MVKKILDYFLAFNFIVTYNKNIKNIIINDLNIKIFNIFLRKLLTNFNKSLIIFI